MIRLNSENLTDTTQKHLDDVQKRIDREADFVSSVSRAQSEWDSKTSSTVKRDAFSDIKAALVKMCVSVEICNYCENNEATDIEHIYPKSFFPGRAFRWDNYLLACKTCNTGYKLDGFAIFDPAKSENMTELIRGQQPVNDDSAFINPRVENPLDYFWLDIVNQTFVLDPRLDLNQRNKNKAVYTLELLGLNDRETLIKARKEAAKYYLDRLKQYVSVRDSATFDALEEAIQDPDKVDQTLPLEHEKSRICQQIVNDVRTYAHPTVWQELKRQRHILSKTNRLLNQAPEALDW